MKTLFNMMTCHELSELSLFSWPDVTSGGPRHTPPAALPWGDGGLYLPWSPHCSQCHHRTCHLL